jgi:hypothetical protein
LKTNGATKNSRGRFLTANRNAKNSRGRFLTANRNAKNSRGRILRTNGIAKILGGGISESQWEKVRGEDYHLLRIREITRRRRCGVSMSILIVPVYETIPGDAR